MIPAKTICINCKHFKPHFRYNGEIAYHWSRCTHPSIQRVAVQDPVSGEKAYAVSNDLGNVFYDDAEKHPYCKDYNHGNCKMYEKRMCKGSRDV